MFDLLQRVMGFPYGFAADEIKAAVPAERDSKRDEPPVVLDVGCGTARVLKYLDGVRYIGLEPSDQYVAAARAKFPDTEFRTGRFQDLDRSDLLGSVDVFVTIGVLHHITDTEVVDLARISTEVLKPNGCFVSLDPAFVEDQHGLARLLARTDRGDHVRTPAHLGSLIGQVFANVDTEVRDDLRRYPYTHVVVRAKA